MPWGAQRGGVAVWSCPAGTRTHTNVFTLCRHPLVNLFPVHSSPEIHNGSAAPSLCRIPHISAVGLTGYRNLKCTINGGVKI